MISVQQKERELYEEVWQAPAYSVHAPGEDFIEMFMDIAGVVPEATYRLTVLDAGTGTGRGALALRKRGFNVTMTDLTPDGLTAEAQELPFFRSCIWDDLSLVAPYRFGGQYDYVYCTDVMEHLPTQYVMLAVMRLLAIARHGVFFNIALAHETWGTFAGEETLHKSVFAFTWWRDNLATVAKLVECRDLIKSGVYFVRAR